MYWHQMDLKTIFSKRLSKMLWFLLRRFKNSLQNTWILPDADRQCYTTWLAASSFVIRRGGQFHFLWTFLVWGNILFHVPGPPRRCWLQLPLSASLHITRLASVSRHTHQINIFNPWMPHAGVGTFPLVIMNKSEGFVNCQLIHCCLLKRNAALQTLKYRCISVIVNCQYMVIQRFVTTDPKFVSVLHFSINLGQSSILM